MIEDVAGDGWFDLGMDALRLGVGKWTGVGTGVVRWVYSLERRSGDAEIGSRARAERAQARHSGHTLCAVLLYFESGVQSLTE